VWERQVGKAGAALGVFEHASPERALRDAEQEPAVE
jgi:hypothetical protein